MAAGDVQADRPENRIRIGGLGDGIRPIHTNHPIAWRFRQEEFCEMAM